MTFQALTTTEPAYTSAGMISTITRRQGLASETSGMTYDAAGRLETSTTAGLTTRYGYDSAGRTRTRTEEPRDLDPLSTEYDFDTAGRMAATTTP